MASRQMQTISLSVFIALVLGGIPVAYSQVASLEYSAPSLAALFGYILLVLNFSHAKLRASEDKRYHNRVYESEAATASFLGFLLSSGVSVAILLQATVISDAKRLAAAVALTRLIDLALVSQSRGHTSSPLVLRAHTLWILSDATIFSIALAAYLTVGETGYAYIAYGYAASQLVEVSIDYLYNRELYFFANVEWGDFAATWNEMQGQRGDCYRVHVVIPAVQDFIRSSIGQQQARILDLGAGNGCIARSIASLNDAYTILAVDKYPEMIRVARSYGSSQIDYRVLDFIDESGLVDGGDYEVVLAVLTIQDCPSISAAFDAIANNLAKTGCAIVVYENEKGLAPNISHATTRRRWVDRRSHGDRGRRQMVTWTFPSSERPFTTVTRAWTTDEYRRAAIATGLQVTSIRELRAAPALDALPDDCQRMMASYAATPRFNVLTLARLPDARSGS